ncbi:hypothetical protein [Bradyrhizobium rifense]|uniref:hypothetical protein n=1 Tax=Bradyrhizobium rifense TaxID=515499 RepID=UPI0016530290|nr:hypothetical protein [Bradyrhizobium rifense]
MPYPLGVHEALQAWQDGEITYRRCLRLLGVDTIADLYAACRSSGVNVRIEPTEEEIRLSNRAIEAIDLQLRRRAGGRRRPTAGVSATRNRSGRVGNGRRAVCRRKSAGMRTVETQKPPPVDRLLHGHRSGPDPAQAPTSTGGETDTSGSYFAGGRSGLSTHFRAVGSCSGSSSQAGQTYGSPPGPACSETSFIGLAQ